VLAALQAVLAAFMIFFAVRRPAGPPQTTGASEP
jgi:hypothetical protein